MYIKHVWFKVLGVLIILILIFILYKHFFPLLEHYRLGGSNVLKELEGFQQQEKYKVQYNQAIYQDPFYVENYDDIHQSQKRLRLEVLTIVETTSADEENSSFLDIGSGTGYAVKELNDLGYEALGVDQSQAMVSYSEKQNPKGSYQCGDVGEPMLFEQGAFTHVLCLYYTIYQFQDKAAFFRNCHHWLQPGGYLVIHLVDPENFDRSPPSAKHILFGSPKIVGDERNKDSVVDFTHYQYKSSWKKENENHHRLTETFQMIPSRHIRENEQTLYMEKIQDILSLATYNGFTMKSVGNLKSSTMDKHQYLYFLERML